MKYGFDIGGTKMEIVAFDDDFNIQFQQRKPTPSSNYNSFLDSIVELIKQADAVCGITNEIGIGMPGVINNKTGKLIASNIPGASGQNIVSDLKTRIARNIAVGNDAKCFTISEANGGAADGLEIVFGAILGTGVGGGLCINGQLISGASGATGEWGHSPLPAFLYKKYDLPLLACGCGLQSCIEKYISGSGVIELYYLCSGNRLSETHEIIDLMRQGDINANKAFRIFIDILACSLATMVNVYDPNAIVFGGGLSKVDEIYQLLPQQLNKYIISSISMPLLLKAKFGDSSGVRGAAMLLQQIK
ncbi:MAG: ROK family protein [Psychromonas sp.]